MRNPLFCANWKMNQDYDRIKSFFQRFSTSNCEETGCEIVIFPSFTFIFPIFEYFVKHTGIEVGGQDVNENPSGAYTGEVSAQMLYSAGATWVIIGHSERRDIYHETDELISKKIKIALKYGLKPVLCVGEHLETRKQGDHIDHVKSQLETDLVSVSSTEMELVTIAYEPVWAIGTGLASAPEDAEEMMKFIRKFLDEQFDRNVAMKTRILYGGSVNPDNMAGYIRMPNIDGALVGGASLDPDSFMSIIQAVSR